MKYDSTAASRNDGSVDAIGNNNMNKVVVSDRLNFGTLAHQLLEYSKADRISDMMKVFKANEIRDMVKMSYRMTVVSDVLSSLSQNDDDDEDLFECSLCSWGQTKRLCTSCEQKLEQAGKEEIECESEFLKLRLNRFSISLKADIEAELHDIELFKQPPPPLGDCPICFLLLPSNSDGFRYKSCCGKMLCSGCEYAPVYDDQGNKVAQKTCPFCRTLAPTPKEKSERTMKRVERGDPIAIHIVGCNYMYGNNGFPQDYEKALELLHRAADLGYGEAYNNIGNAYKYGEGVDVDKKKAKYYYELAAVEGFVTGRTNLGIAEGRSGSMDRAVKHFMIAVRGGSDVALDLIKQLSSVGCARKDDYANALRAYQKYLDEVKSDQRDQAAAFGVECKYY